MSNIGSTALSTAKQHAQRNPNVPPATAREQAYNQGTMSMLDEARGVVEDATSQGQQIQPLVYQMLGLQPQYDDHSTELQQSQQQMDDAQNQIGTAQDTISQLKGIPKGKRSPEQKKQLRQLNKQLPSLQKSLESAKESFGRVQTLPRTMTGLSRLDPNQIPAESPFSAQNPLHQAQATEAQRLNQYLAGSAPGATGTEAAAVDPTLVHQYNAAEAQLRATLAQRYGPDFENSSVGQMALQNFARQKNEAYATWNQQQVTNYQNLAFQGQQNLQALLANQMGLMYAPSQQANQMAGNLANIANARQPEQSSINQMRLGRAGVTTNVSNPLALGAAAMGGAGSLAQAALTPYNTQGNTVAGDVWNKFAGGAGTTAAMSPAAASAAGTGGYGAGMSAEGVGAGMSAAEGGVVAGAGTDATLAALA